MALNVRQRAVAIVEPLIFLLLDFYALTLTFFDLLFIQRRPRELLSWSKFMNHGFSRFWLLLAPRLVQKEVDMGVPELVASASGTVIEYGPGSGSQVSRYDPKKVTKIYGVEPCKGLHAQLRENVKKAGLSDIYTIVPCGIEDAETLRKYGVDQKPVDTVLSVSVLCCVRDPKETVAALYRMLKPGGQMIVFEHVKSRDWVSSTVQAFYMLIWPYVLVNCHLDRDTAQTLREAGRWAKIDLKLPTKEDAWKVIPHISGHLTKVA